MEFFMGEIQTWLDSWAQKEDQRGLEPCCPHRLGERLGAGGGQKPHRAQVSSLGQKGQEKRRATGKGEGWRKDGVLRLRASDRRLVCSWQECPHSALSNGLGAGHGLSRFSDVAGILTREV